MPENIVEIVDQDNKTYEKSENKEEPLLVLTQTGEREFNKLFKSAAAMEAFKELLEEESGNIEDEVESKGSFLVPNTAFDYNAMHGAAIERRNHYNLVFENLMDDLARHEENPKEGETTESIKQGVLENFNFDSDLMETIQEEVKAARIKEARDKKRREYKREAGLDTRDMYGG